MRHATDNGKVVIYLEGSIDTKNAGDVEAEISSVVDECEASSAELDATSLDYISSAGLRVVMRLLKRLGDVSVTGANCEVYDVFEMTGFTELMSVRRALRSVSVEGCPAIGSGATATVYRLDPETIVKVYNENVFMSMIEHDHARSRAAFLSGIPTAIPFETVRVGDRFGTVFELLDARDLVDVMADDREHLEAWVRSFACEMRRLHQVEVDPDDFEDAKARSIRLLPSLEGVVCTHEEVERLQGMYEVIPDRATFLHGDCHPGNIMVQGDEFVLIDLSSSGMGHPIFDLMSMGIMYKLPLMSGREGYATKRKSLEPVRPFDFDEATLIWNTFLAAYFDTDDEEFLAKVGRQVLAYATLRLLFVAIAMPGYMPSERLEALKQIPLAYSEHLEPLCF